MSKSGGRALICFFFSGRSLLFWLDMHNAVSTVAAPGSVLFILVRAQEFSQHSFAASRSIRPLPGNEQRSPGRPRAQFTKRKQWLLNY